MGSRTCLGVVCGEGTGATVPSVARSVKATACMTCIALMGLEFTCYDPRSDSNHLNHTISRGVPPLTGHGFQYDPRTDSKESAPEIDLPLHSDTDKPEPAPPLQQDSIASSTSSSSRRSIGGGMLVIGLLAGFVSGFHCRPARRPALPPGAGSQLPRAAQPPAPQPAAA